METKLIQAATAHINPGPAKAELKPLNSSKELEQALQATKVCNASESDLKEILRRVMLLSGIRAANIPVNEEKQVLINFIYKKFGGLTLAEIQLAFEKAVAGELECEANCYENFSPQYFGQIMSSYKKWAAQKFNENQMYLVPQTTNLLTMDCDWKELCEMYYQDYRTNNLHLSVMPYQLYDEFVRCKMMAEDAYEDWLEIAEPNILADLFIQKNEALNIIDENIAIQAISRIESREDEYKIINMAKKLAVEYLYKQAKSKGYQNLFVKCQ